MKTKHVVVVPFNPQWNLEFLRIKETLETTLGSYAQAIEHVGSTAVNGLAAKPIIDIDIVIESYRVFEIVKNRLAGSGYIHEGDQGIKDREAFKYEHKPELMLHHLYVCPQDSAELKRHLLFRQYLMTHAQEREAYGDLKLDLAKRFPEDIESYMAGKSSFINNILSKCGSVNND
jgi:GrpB-like predicted nucleotidyltransferase (UPF0157 family)